MGGAATNSGINYQQRIAALVLAAQYTRFDLSLTFGLGSEMIIESTHFETDTPIDDLKITCKGYQVFLQIKRSLSLQTDEGTDLHKTLDQFVKQFLSPDSKMEYYVLATSPQSSRTITYDLAKITESIRLNDASFSNNPLNQSEKETNEKFKSMVHGLFVKHKGKNASNEEFIALAKRIHVSVVDIEQGRSDERVAMILLKSEQLLEPSLVWKMLIANCLEYARKRQSINSNALQEILDRYKIEKPDNTPSDYTELEEYFKTEIIPEGQFPVAKEVLLVESFTDNVDYLIAELYRFSDEGKIKHKFTGNKVLLEAGMEWTLIHRAATFTGVDRFISQNEQLLEDKKVAILPAKDIEEAENSDAAALHRKYLVELLRKNKDILKCLHCDKALNPNGSAIVEIDDLDTKSAMGAVHFQCIRVIDRVLGVIGTKDTDTREVFLQSFDYKEWAKLMMKGQGMVNQLKESSALDAREKVIFWSSDNKEFRDYRYCLKFNLEDGSSNYMTDRGRIHRFSKSDAEDARDQMTMSLKKAKEEGNPQCYTSPGMMFGDYNQLLELKKEEDTIIEIESIEIDRYSKLHEKREEHVNFYAPICILRDVEEESIMNIQNVIPLISNPLTFKSILETWKNIGFEMDWKELEMKIIKSDAEFDSYMREFFANGMVPIVDPMFNKKGELVKGLKIAHMQQQLAGRSEEFRTLVSDPNWNKGDKVILRIPSLAKDQYPIGVLLEDEFQGADGQRYVLFKPVDEDLGAENSALVVPSQLLERVKS